MQSFNNVKELDQIQARNGLDIPYLREDLVTENPYDSTRYQLIKREDTGYEMGIINNKKVIFPYPEVMDWVIKEFDNSGLKYKLQDSIVKKNGEMFQQYLFDYEIDSPDGNDLSPMVIVKSSYVGSPLDMHFGTYRFVCSNGVMVGNTIEKIHVSARETDLLQSSISADIKKNLEKFDEVAGLYKELQEETFNPYLQSLILNQYITAGYKKAILQELAHTGNIQILKEKIKGKDFTSETQDQLFRIVNEITAWEFYNIVTNVVTRKAKGANSRLSYYNVVSDIFEV